MPSAQTCPECGTELPPGGSPWLCPQCLLAQATDNPASKVATLDAPSQAGPSTRDAAGEAFPQPFGGYELLKRVGRGGMGVVYKARQISLDRTVAVKVLPHGVLADKEQVRRFRTEASAAGSLQHPNIVAVHEVGLWEDRHYLVMDFVEGPTLAELARAGPLPPPRAACYIQTIAEAIHHAHERGILHRDLKPSNVLIDAANQPRITDFGLAKRLESGTDLTVSGQVLGSPQYMPPEQAAGRRGQVGRRSDVYALGAILYHLLTGRPPFVGEALSNILPQVANDEPLTPRQLNPAVPPDLETLCLKCLEKEPNRRYPTALALAEELGRFLRGEPILARPISRAGKAWRWCRRKPQMASLAAAAALLFMLGFGGVTLMWRRAESQRQRAEADEYILAMNAAQQALNAKNPVRAMALLDRHRPLGKSEIRNPKSEIDLRGCFEWRYLWQQCQTEAEAVIGRLSSAIRSLEVSADGQWLLAASDGGGVKVWSLPTGEEIPLAAERGVMACAAFSPDSRLLLFCDQSPQSFGTIAVWDIQARKRLAPIRDARPVGPMAFSPDGQWFGYGVAPPSSRKGYFGKHVVLLAMPSRQKKVNEVISLTEILDGRHATDWVFTPDSRSVIFSEADPDCRIVLCDLVAGSEARYFPGHREATTAIAISPDGHILATGAGYTDKDIKLWEVPSLRLLGELSGHEGWISALRFSPDGQTLASASADQTIRLWDVAARKARRVFAGLPGEVSRLCFTPDGQKLFSGASDGTIQRWSADAQQVQSKLGFWRRQPGLDSVTMTSDGKRFAGLRQGGVHVGGVQGVTPPGELLELGTNNTCLLFSSDGRCLFAGTQSGEVQMWSLDHRQPLRCLRGPAEPATRLRQDKQGRILVVIHWKNEAQLGRPVRVAVWNTTDWQQQKSWTVSGVASSYEVSPDGRWLAAGDSYGPVQVWSLTDPSEIRTVASLGGTPSLAFSPDGRLLAAATLEGVVKVWEMPRLRELTEFRERSQSLFALAFSPDSRRLATAGEGAEAIKLWEVATWQELITLGREGETLSELLFGTDGNQLTARNSQGDLLFWRVPSFAEIAQRENQKAGAK
jgi:WD40 repeat protein